MDDEPMWVADHVVALTLGSAITIPETAKEFAIKAVSFPKLFLTDPPRESELSLQLENKSTNELGCMEGNDLRNTWSHLSNGQYY
ncbi:hypothetical protein Tco_0205650 [Tanacetum coccineum]